MRDGINFLSHRGGTMDENLNPNSLHIGAPFQDVEVDLLPRRTIKIMVIDDDQDFRLMVCEMLVNEGFRVTTAKDGEAGLNNLLHQNELPDLILLDLTMPILGGLEFRRAQLKLERINQIPILFMTGQGLVEGEPCLLKPFDEREFIDTVKRQLV